MAAKLYYVKDANSFEEVKQSPIEGIVVNSNLDDLQGRKNTFDGLLLEIIVDMNAVITNISTVERYSVLCKDYRSEISIGKKVRLYPIEPANPESKQGRNTLNAAALQILNGDTVESTFVSKNYELRN